MFDVALVVFFCLFVNVWSVHVQQKKFLKLNTREACDLKLPFSWCCASFRPTVSILRRGLPNCLDSLPRESSNQLVRLRLDDDLGPDRVLPISFGFDAIQIRRRRCVFARAG